MPCIKRSKAAIVRSKMRLAEVVSLMLISVDKASTRRTAAAPSFPPQRRVDRITHGSSQKRIHADRWQSVPTPRCRDPPKHANGSWILRTRQHLSWSVSQVMPSLMTDNYGTHLSRKKKRTTHKDGKPTSVVKMCLLSFFQGQAGGREGIQNEESAGGGY
ncbi:hypothetical protein DUNSADRAFT_12587 [Dunaliella salina]|uniref:Encoded protein n=1 Tax=Dunaliella salina TaxID=3046 RepID=A0ABQ7GAZ9_DUNSA|nr:hypothetical protein DUNSADRAFT_12587 [Dunaliella salina]|eukprot:KAF5831775.1 hypothetical protein DUNSADRAFT_12587 [Dunaliella salina]